MASEHGALNMAQGFPDFGVSQELIDLVSHHMNKGRNQYPPSLGIPQLRSAIAGMHENITGTNHDPDAEITVTTGATEGLFCAISVFVNSGDEVIIFDPAYDSYEPVINLQGAKAVHCKLAAPDFKVNWEEVQSKITSKTSTIIINTPHNPTGMVMTDEDMQTLQGIATDNDLLVISDEVYNHLVYDEIEHKSVLQYPELAKRSVAVYSFGKTFHATGWKMGYVVAPTELTAEIRKIHQFVTFTTHSPGQFALADFMQDSATYSYLPTFFQEKRDAFFQGIQGSRFTGIPSNGTYFQLLSFEKISDEKDTEIAEKLTKEFKLATIPISVFYEDGYDASYLRFCFAKEIETLEKAAKIMCKI